MTGMPAGETARVLDDEGNAVYSYRSFASVIGIVASLVAAIVILSGVAATLFLLLEQHPITAIAALALSVFFSLVIVMLVPPMNVTLFTDDKTPAITISQRSRTSFPSATHAVVTPDGHTLALLRKSIVSRFGRNRWTLLDANGRELGAAQEESLSRALTRKLLGKFNRAYESDIDVETAGRDAARILRRTDHDVLHISAIDRASDAVDDRVLIALATLVLGAEP